MKIALIKPAAPIRAEQIERARRSIRYRYPDAQTEVVSRDERSHLRTFDAVVHLEETKRLIPTAYEGFAPKQKVYKVDYLGKLSRCAPLRDEDYPHFKNHPFNWAGPRHDDNFYYFPYGYLFRLAGMGPTNEFGHRIAFDIEPLADRDRGHILIHVFGGSAAWSIFSFYDEMFAQVLQDKLNAHAASRKSGLRFTVLNFATPGNVVMNEMTTYMLFSHRLKPDVVIAHDGFNDLYYGEMSNVRMLNKYQITYQYNLEAWSQLLHDTREFGLGWSRDDVPVINYPPVIIAAYQLRLRQFRRMAESDGAAFIAGLQPMIFSKKALSAQEKEWITFFKIKDEPYRNMPYLYQTYKATTPEKEYAHFVDFDGIFGGYGAESTLLGDIMHTVPGGDEVIAERYFQLMRERFWGGWEARVS